MIKKMLILFSLLIMPFGAGAAVFFSPNPITVGGLDGTFEADLSIDTLPLDAIFTLDAAPALTAPVVNANIQLDSNQGSITGLAADLFDSADALVTALTVTALPGGLGTALSFSEILANGEYRIHFTGVVTGAPTLQGQIAAVPVPAAVWLFGSALVGVFGVRRSQAAV